MTLRVLVIDSMVDDVRLVRDSLDRLGGFRVRSARGIDDACALLLSGSFDVALVASELWSGDGAGLVHVVRAEHPELAVVLLTGDSPGETLPALKLGAHDFITRPQLGAAEQLATRLVAAVDECRALRRRDTMVRWLEREARTDHLTGLYTRRAFDERLQEACRAARLGGRVVSLILMDVTGTRMVNEAHGHGAGDAMIRRAARAISRSIRGGDFAARIGGDDFGVLLRDGDLDLARRIARRIAHELERLNVEALDGDVPVGLTFGVASGPAPEPGQLFAAADQQLSGHKGARTAVTPIWPDRDHDGPSVA